MSPIDQLKAVLCDPSGKCCITGSDEDRAIVDRALQALAQPEKEPMSFQTWRSRQHGDPEEIGFLQALKHAYESGQYSVSPPRKEWVGLTDEELDSINGSPMSLEYSGLTKFARAIEAALKEKNT